MTGPLRDIAFQLRRRTAELELPRIGLHDLRHSTLSTILNT
ncbi:hypothetical protein ACFYWS_25310 [Streptomyces sp. NPDC002795]